MQWALPNLSHSIPSAYAMLDVFPLLLGMFWVKGTAACIIMQQCRHGILKCRVVVQTIKGTSVSCYHCCSLKANAAMGAAPAHGM